MKVPALIISTALALGGATLFLANAEAAVAYTFTTSPISYDTQLSLGFTFTANVNFDVTSLGYYNGPPGGFVTPHEVGSCRRRRRWPRPAFGVHYACCRDIRHSGS